MPAVSIIVPVYNCETFVRRCVDSILGQRCRDIQLILVDDGSTDGTGRICDDYASADHRVTVIHQKNAGVSAARNAGLDIAAGTYIGFVDADDYIAPDTYEKAMEAIGDCDMIMWDAVTVWSDGAEEDDTITLLDTDAVLTSKDWTPELLAQMAGAVWRCLYKAELIRDVRFPVGIKLSEDRLFNLHAMGKAAKLRYLKYGMYYRYVRAGSAVHSYHGDKFEKNLKAMEIATEIIEKYWEERYLGVYTRMFVIGGALDAIYEICSRSFPGKSRMKAIKAVLNNRKLISSFPLCPAQGVRERLLRKKNAPALLLVGIAVALKNSVIKRGS